MIAFVTLDSITHELLNVVRGDIIAQSEPISLRLLESFVHQYRGVLLKRDLDKGKSVNPDYIQVISSLELEEVDVSYPSSITTSYRTFRTKIKIPKTLDLNFKSGLTYVGTITGQEIIFVPEGRAQWQQHKKYTKNDPIAYLKDGYLYVENDKELRYISVRGVFEVPPEVSHLSNPTETITDVTASSPYPIPIHLLPTLKQMILQQELGIMVNAFSDTKADDASNVSPNTDGNIKYTSTSRRT